MDRIIARQANRERSRLYTGRFRHRGLPRCQYAYCGKPIRWGIIIRPEYAAFDGEGNMYSRREEKAPPFIICRSCAKKQKWMRRPS